ncbi:acyltransferase [Streptomyces sp. NPDC013187]|uniref:acyltransferase n=1 Tax=Streptomyces sp. NPDC013187 TaxID=3364865 RepID=UPI00368F11BD
MAAPTESPSGSSERRPELDAIRMLVVIGLIFFHSALMFATEGDFYVTNSETTEVVTVIAGFGVVWAMPLLFLISGLGAWHVLLLTFSLMLAPLPRRLPHESARRAVDRVAAATLHRRGVLLVPALLFAAVCAFVGMEEDYAGWHRWSYLLFFAAGFLLAADDRFRTAMRREARPAACLGVLLFISAAAGFTTADDPFTQTTPVTSADRTRRQHVYGYLAAAVLPLYVLHQPIVVAVAHVVVGWSAPIAVEYVVLVAMSLALTLLAYELLVRRLRVTRFLFGMRT